MTQRPNASDGWTIYGRRWLVSELDDASDAALVAAVESAARAEGWAEFAQPRITRQGEYVKVALWVRTSAQPVVSIREDGL